jgi:hypothetical protein
VIAEGKFQNRRGAKRYVRTMMKSFPRPWYLTKWSARSDSRRSRNEALAADLGAETAIVATERRRAGDMRTGSRRIRRVGEVGAGTVAAAREVAAAGDMASGVGEHEGFRGEGVFCY